MRTKNKMTPMPMRRKHAAAKTKIQVQTIEKLQAQPEYARLSPTDKLVSMLKIKPLGELIIAGHVYTAKIFGERVGYSYDHVRRLCRAGKIIPLPILLGSGKVWREYYFLAEHIDAVFANKES